MERQLELFNATGGGFEPKRQDISLEVKNLRPYTLCKVVMLLRQKGMQVYVGDTVPSDGCMIPPERRRSFVCMKNRQEDRMQHNSEKRYRYGKRRLTIQTI